MSWRRIPPNSLLPFVRVPRVIKKIWWYGKSCEWRTCPGSSTCWCGLSPSTLLVKADLWIWRDCRIKHERSVKQWDSLRSLLWFNRLRWGSSIMSWMTWWWWPTPNCSTTKNNSWWSFPRVSVPYFVALKQQPLQSQLVDPPQTPLPPPLPRAPVLLLVLGPTQAQSLG